MSLPGCEYVPIGDPVALADAVCRVLELPDDQWRMMSRASYEISKQFDWDKSAEILERALLKALQRRAVVQSKSADQIR